MKDDDEGGDEGCGEGGKFHNWKYTNIFLNLFTL